jgi:hypothetical protein
MDVAIGEVLHDNYGNSLSSFIFFSCLRGNPDKVAPKVTIPIGKPGCKRNMADRLNPSTVIGSLDIGPA